MKPTQWVPAVIAIECAAGCVVAFYAKEWGKAVYWFGGMILNVGLAL